jgi:glucan biosynthesis protein C
MILEGSQSASIKPNIEIESQRLYYLDWLRIFAVFLLFLFHTARIFDIGEDNYVENAIPSPTITIIFIYMVNFFHMPLFFLISGASSNLSIRKRGIKKYCVERVLRLLIPFVFGLLVIVPPQPFLAAKTYNGYTGSYLNWLFFDYFLTGFGNIEGYRGTLTPAHLWFIGVLFVLSFIALPIIVLLNRKDRLLMRKIGEYAEKRPFLTLYLIPVIIVTAIKAIPIEILGKHVLYYLACFILGYILVNDNNLGFRIKQFRKYLVIIMGIGYPTIAVYEFLRYFTGFGNSTISYFVDGFGIGVIMWATNLTLYCVFMEKVNRTGFIHRYASQAAYPVYIQHQTWLVLIAYYIVPLNMHYGWKFVIIMSGGFLLSMIGFEIIRRVNILRFFFGMKWVPQLHHKKRNVNNIEK